MLNSDVYEARKADLKIAVRGAYDIQKIRIQTGNRIAMNFRAKLGQEAGKTLDEKEAKKLIARIKADYTRLTDGIVGERLPRETTFKGGKIISQYTELVLVHQYMSLLKSEQEQFRMLEKFLKDWSIWTNWMIDISGIGPAIAGIIISEIDISKANYPSSLWMYAGLDVASDGKGRSRCKEHLVPKTYNKTNGEICHTTGITFNPFLKTKLIKVLGTSFLRTGGTYSEIYRDYKNRLENHAVYGLANDAKRIEDAKKNDKIYSPKLHRHNMAIRYMIKRFLVDLYAEWRKLENLPVSEEYSVAKLGIVHSRTV